MRKLVILILAWLICINKTHADIAPFPIEGQGIISRNQTDIKMVYENVKIDLTLDSSFVYCYFRLKNMGKAQSIQMGYPNMNYCIKRVFSESGFSPIYVYENDVKIQSIRFFTPDSLQQNDENDLPWYLWETHFEKGETKIYKVSYALPFGVVKDHSYSYFKYLLNTGAGWYGPIDTAEVSINLKKFDYDLILKITPKNFVHHENQINWKFYNFEPTKLDDISLCYERKKGRYDEYLKDSTLPVYILDDTSRLSLDMRRENSVENYNTNNLACVKILKSGETHKLIPFCSSNIILIYSKEFALNKLKKIITIKFPKVNSLHYDSILDFEKKYQIVINGKQPIDGLRYFEIVNADENKFEDVSIKKINKNKYQLNIKIEE